MRENFKKLNLIEIIIILLIIFFIFNYINQYKMNKRLTNLNSKVSSLAIEVKEIKKIKEIKEKLNIMEENIKIASGTVYILNTMRPNIQIITNRNDWRMKFDNLKIMYSINNLGKFGCFIKEPRLIITTEKIFNENEVKGQLIEGVDYILQRDSTVGNLDPEGKTIYEQIIVFNKKRLSKTFNKTLDKIFIRIIFHAKTDPAIINSLPFFLKEIIGDVKLSKLSELTVIKDNFVKF